MFYDVPNGQFDIALAADGVDICETMFDGDPSEEQLPV
jgi:hypothetical protein